MKTILRYAIRVAAVGSCSVALLIGSIPAQSSGAAGRGVMSPEEQQARLNALIKAVGLTADQTSQVVAINNDAMSQMSAIRGSGDSSAAIVSGLAAIRTDQQTKIRALLSATQVPKYDAFLASTPQGRRPSGTAPSTPTQ